MDPDERLARSQAGREAAGRATGRLRAAEDECKRRAFALSEAEQRRNFAVTDVERLEGVSLARLRATVRGSRADDLAAAQAARDAAVREVAAARARLDAAAEDQQEASAALRRLGDVDREHRAALAAQEAWVQAQDPARAAKLGTITDRRSALEAERAEIAEARSAGAVARGRLKAAQQRLGQADTMSAWDTWLGGGVVVSAVKHHQLGDVSRLLARADAALQAFSRELADLKLRQAPAVTVGRWQQAFDVLVDDPFTDFAVRGRIKDTAQQIDTAIARVNGALAALDTQERVVDDALAACAAERERVLTG